MSTSPESDVIDQRVGNDETYTALSPSTHPSSTSLSEDSDDCQKSSNLKRSRILSSVDSSTNPWLSNPELYGVRRSNRCRNDASKRSLYVDNDDDLEKQLSVEKSSCSSSSAYGGGDVYNTDNENEIFSSGSSIDLKRNKSFVPRSKSLGLGRKRATKRLAATKRFPVSKQRYKEDSTDDNDSDTSYKDNKNYFNRRASVRGTIKPCYKISDSENDLNVEEEIEDTLAAGDESENLPTVDRVISLRKGAVGDTGTYSIESNLDKNGKDRSSFNQGIGEEIQYKIKWKGISHLHNTWESLNTLNEMQARGMKKLDNFNKRRQEFEDWKLTALPEDIEYVECQLEMAEQLLESHVIPERVFDCTRNDDGSITHYYVKWTNLPYSEATWEVASFLERINIDVIVQFEERQHSQLTPSKSCKVLRCRPKFVPVTDQSILVGNDLQLRDYQLDGVNWLINRWCKNNSVILADEMGLGKTIQTICFLSYLFHTHSLYGPFVIVIPLSTLDSWQREFQKWSPRMNVLAYVGDVKSRSIIRDNEWTHLGNKKLKFNAILVTYEILLKDRAFLSAVSWAALIIDEAHRLKNDESMLYQALMDFQSNYRLLITGTPLQNTLKELWSLLHFIERDKFYLWSDFEVDYASASAHTDGYAKLHAILEPFILRRIKKDVEKSLPAKVERILRVDMSRKQKLFYRWILTRNFTALNSSVKGRSSVTSFVNIVMELKKCCNHTLLTKPDDEAPVKDSEARLLFLLKGSGKLLLLDKLLIRLRDTGHRVLIFSQMVRMLDILAEYMTLRRFSFQRLDGGIRGELRRQALEHFNAPGSNDFCFLLSTRAGGLGINLSTADTVVIFDSDWNPQNDLQAQARAHRIGQKEQVNVYRLVTSGSVEENIIERAKKKMILDVLVIQRMDTTGTTILKKPNHASRDKAGNPFSKEELTAILKFGTAELFKDETPCDEAVSSEDLACDIDEILLRAEANCQENEEQLSAGASDNGLSCHSLLSSFKMASFTVNEDELVKNFQPTTENEADSRQWSEIIPLHLREEVEAEERQRQKEDFLPRNRARTVIADTSKVKKSSFGNGSDEEFSDGEDRDKKIRGRIGFTDAEIRRFIKAYKRFPYPLLRLDAVAYEAELQDKTLTDLLKLGTDLHDRCSKAVDKATLTASSKDEAAKKGKNSISVILGRNVVVNAKTLLDAEQLLAPLGQLILDHGDRLQGLECLPSVKFKNPGFDLNVKWTQVDDLKLLLGISMYGLGSWDSIKFDPSLGLTCKILPNTEKKPQAKDLDARSLFLLKCLQRNVRKKTGSQESHAQRKSFKSVDYIEASECESSGKNEKVEPFKKCSGLQHIPKQELEKSVFMLCKEKMRAVKKSLKALNSNPEQNKSRKHLITIGQHINFMVASGEIAKRLTNELWIFVSMFSALDSKGLQRKFKHYDKKQKLKAEKKKGNSDIFRSSDLHHRLSSSNVFSSNSLHQKSAHLTYKEKRNSGKSIHMKNKHFDAHNRRDRFSTNFSRKRPSIHNTYHKGAYRTSSHSKESEVYETLLCRSRHHRDVDYDQTNIGQSNNDRKKENRHRKS